MLSNAYFLAKFRFDTAENEPAKNLQIFEKCIFEKCIFEKCIFEKCQHRSDPYVLGAERDFTAVPAHACPDPQAGPHYSASLPQARGHLAAAVTRDAVSKNRTFLSIFVKIFIDFGGFVLGCIEADFCE